MIANNNSNRTEKHSRLYLAIGLLLMLSELWKQYTLTFVLNDGAYQWSYIPFQLCSLPMYLCLFIGITGRVSAVCREKQNSKTEALCAAGTGMCGLIRTTKLRETRTMTVNSGCSNIQISNAGQRIIAIRRACMVFLADYSLMSGIVTFLDTSGLHYGYAPLTVHSYLWHIAIAGIGVYSGLLLSAGEKHSMSGPDIKSHEASNSSRSDRLTLHDFRHATYIFAGCCVIAEIINLSFDQYGIVNMFYINPHYYVSQIVFNELAHVIPNNFVILLYILCIITAAFIVHLMWIKYCRAVNTRDM